MARRGGVSPWFTRNLRGEALRDPTPGYTSKWDVAGGDLAFDPYTSPVYNMLQQQQQQRRGIAGAQLGRMMGRRGGGGGRSRASRDALRDARNMAILQDRMDRIREGRAESRRLAAMRAAEAPRYSPTPAIVSQFGVGTMNAARAPGQYAQNLRMPLAAAIGGPLRSQGGGGGVRTRRDPRAERVARAIMLNNPEMAQGGSGRRVSGRGGLGRGFQSTKGLPAYARQHGSPGGGQLGLVGKLPGAKKGTVPGTVPETGPYEIHKNEIVLSADQVDPPLLQALKHDKLRKMASGQMDGKGTGPGHPSMPNPHAKKGVTVPTAKTMVRDEFQHGSLPPGNVGAAPAPSWDLDIGYGHIPFIGPILEGVTTAAEDEGPDPIADAYRFWSGTGPYAGTSLYGRLGAALGGGAEATGREIEKFAEEFGEGWRGEKKKDDEEPPAIPEVERIEDPRFAYGATHDIVTPGLTDVERAIDKIAEWEKGGRQGKLELELGPGDVSEEQLERERQKTVSDIKQRGDDLRRFLDRQKAQRMRDYAMSADWMDPQSRKAMMQEARFMEQGVEQAIQAEKQQALAGAQLRSQIGTELMKIEAADRRIGQQFDQEHNRDALKQAAESKNNAAKWFIEAVQEGEDGAAQSALFLYVRGIMSQAKAEGLPMSQEDAMMRAVQDLGPEAMQFLAQ